LFGSTKSKVFLSFDQNLIYITIKVFKNNNGSWDQLGGTIILTGERAYNEVAINSDGDIIAIPYLQYNGAYPGVIYVYQYRTITQTEWNNGNTTTTLYAAGVPVIITDGDSSWTDGKKYWVQLGDVIQSSSTSAGNKYAKYPKIIQNKLIFNIGNKSDHIYDINVSNNTLIEDLEVDIGDLFTDPSNSASGGNPSSINQPMLNEDLNTFVIISQSAKNAYLFKYENSNWVYKKNFTANITNPSNKDINGSIMNKTGTKIGLGIDDYGITILENSNGDGITWATDRKSVV
jgi:hypothetical protein